MNKKVSNPNPLPHMKKPAPPPPPPSLGNKIMTDEFKDAIANLRVFIEVNNMSLEDAYAKIRVQHLLLTPAEADELWKKAKEKYGANSQ